MELDQNPDVVVLRYGLFSVEDARKIAEVAAGAPFAGEHKVVIIAAARAFHEAQNALLKVFEEPPAGTFLFLILPTLGGLLPTLRSRVQVLETGRAAQPEIPEIAEQFLASTKDKRKTLITKLASGKDEDERREHRQEAIALINGIEAIAYRALKKGDEVAELLSDIAVLRGYLHDRSAPVRMILEHLSLVIPRKLL